MGRHVRSGTSRTLLPSIQCGRHFPRRLITQGGDWMHRLLADAIQRDIATRDRRWRCGMSVIRRAAPGEQFVKHHTQCEQVRAAIRLLGMTENFRRGISRSAHDQSAALVARGPGESEIADLRLGLGCEEDVVGLDVAMDDAVLMGVGQAIADAFHDGDPCSGSTTS